MSAQGDAKLFALATWPYVLSVSLGQWGPLLMASTAMPMLGWLAIVKPNLGLALGAGFAPLGFAAPRSGSTYYGRPVSWW